MSSLLIENCRPYDAPEGSAPQSVLVRDGVIESVGGVIESVGAANTAGRPEQVLDAGGRTLAPGFIDVHIQGAGGADVLDATPEALQALSRTCARFGTTGFLATTVYMPGKENPHLCVAAEWSGRDLGGAHLLGIHLEGPFIAPEKRGMIQPDCLAQPSPVVLDDIGALVGDRLSMMTIAPELPGNGEMIGALAGRGTVASHGHSRATYEETLAGFEAGITHVTHLFNAMPSLHHRAPGPLAAIFERPDITCQVIVDGVHIHPAVVRLAYQALGPERCVTITDGTQALGLPDGRYVYHGLSYETQNGIARYVDGTLIGTAVGLDRMLARLVEYTGCPPAAAIRTVTENPARLLGLEQSKGRIAPGYDADLVLLGPDFSVRATIVGGRVVYRAA